MQQSGARVLFLASDLADDHPDIKRLRLELPVVRLSDDQTIYRTLVSQTVTCSCASLSCCPLQCALCGLGPILNRCLMKVECQAFVVLFCLVLVGFVWPISDNKSDVRCGVGRQRDRHLGSNTVYPSDAFYRYFRIYSITSDLGRASFVRFHAQFHV